MARRSRAETPRGVAGDRRMEVKKMTIAEMIKENEKCNQDRINAEIDKYHIAYKIKDSEGNTFCWGGRCKGRLSLVSRSWRNDAHF